MPSTAGFEAANGDPGWAAPALALLAVLLQVQLTLPFGEVGLRVSAADLVLPPFLVAVSLHLRPWAPPAELPGWRVPGMWLWLLALSLWMTVALFHGYTVTGSWTAWALVNKFGGWFVLLGFLLLGWWTGGALRPSRRDEFLKVLFAAGWTVTAGSLLFYGSYKFGLVNLRDSHDLAGRIAGLLGNPNAFGYFLAVLVTLQAPFARRKLLFSPRLHRLGMTLTLLGLIVSGSRTAWIAAAAGLGALLILRETDWRELARAAFIAALATLILYFGRPAVLGIDHLIFGVATPDAPKKVAIALRDAYALQAHPAGIDDRIGSLRAAIALWAESPLLGAGLGGSLHATLAESPRFVTLIHNTGLWLLTETGLVGLGLFVAFFTLSVRALWRTREATDDDPFPIGVLAILAVFAAASLAMEALYQRHLWFLLGAALALPVRTARLPERGPGHGRAAPYAAGAPATSGAWGRLRHGRGMRIGLVLMLLAVGGIAATGGGAPIARAVEATAILADIAAGERAKLWNWIRADPRRRTVAYEVEGRHHIGDVYQQPGSGTLTGIVVVPGALAAGKDDPRLVALANTLARASFHVLVPDIPTVRQLKLRAADSVEIADATRGLAQITRRKRGRVGVVAFSYAAGPALLAALDPAMGEGIRFVVAIGGYYDSVAVLTFFTTGFYREGEGSPWRYRKPNAYGKWLFVRSNLEWVQDASDRGLLEKMAARKLEDLEADISDLAPGLGPEGRSVYDFIDNKDPERVPDLLAALPERIKAEISALDLKGRNLKGLRARLLLVHGRDDTIIPESESRALLAAAPTGAAELYVLDHLAHVDLGEIGVADAITLWRAVYHLLELRDNWR